MVCVGNECGGDLILFVVPFPSAISDVLCAIYSIQNSHIHIVCTLYTTHTNIQKVDGAEWDEARVAIRGLWNAKLASIRRL